MGSKQENRKNILEISKGGEQEGEEKEEGTHQSKLQNYDTAKEISLGLDSKLGVVKYTRWGVGVRVGLFSPSFMCPPEKSLFFIHFHLTHFLM